MFHLNLLTILSTLIFKPEKKKDYEPQTPTEIRKMVQNLSNCPHCHFLIFDNYWSNEIEKNNLKICPTCGKAI